MKATQFAALVSITALISACSPTASGPHYDEYQSPADLTSTAAATLMPDHMDTGFLGIGATRIGIDLIDGKMFANRGWPPALLITPGRHAILFRVFSDPIAAYACVDFTFKAGGSYLVRFTKPGEDKPMVWLEDEATGQDVGPKFEAQKFKEPIMSGALVQLILAHSTPECPATAATQ